MAISNLMKTIICLALLAIISCAKSPLGSLSSALKLLNLKKPLSIPDILDLSVSFTYYVDENSKQASIKGAYSIVLIEDGQIAAETDSMDYESDFDEDITANVTGSGMLTVRGDDSSNELVFFGAFTADFSTVLNGTNLLGTNNHEYSGSVSIDSGNGQLIGKIDTNTWQGVNTTTASTNYRIDGDWSTFQENLHGNSSILAHTTNQDSKQYENYH